jgi:hypothetical protein
MSKKVKTLTPVQLNAVVEKGHASIAANDTVLLLDALSNTRDKWEKTDFKKANDGLYQLLSDCLAVYETKFVNGGKHDQKALRDQLTIELKKAGVKVQKNTNTLTMLTRFVFRSDRKRAHGYASVLVAALSHSVSASNLCNFIVSAGGIEEIKRLSVKKPEAIHRAQQLEDAKTDVKSQIEKAERTPLAQIAIPNLSGSFALCLVKPNLDSTASVVGTLSDLSESMINALVKAMAKDQVKTDDESAQMDKEVQDMLAGKSANDSCDLLAA